MPTPETPTDPLLYPADYVSDCYKSLEPEEKAAVQAAFVPSTDSSSVHSPETNVPESSESTEWGGYVTSDDIPVTFRHSGWARIRSHVRAAMETNRARPRQLKRFDLCGSDPWVAVDPNDPTRFALLSNHCHSRWCVPCARERGRTIATNLRLKLGPGPVRMLTLTLKHSDTPLRAQVSRIYRAFRVLRTRRCWKNNVDGGAAVLEIKHSWNDQLWHVHLHVVYHGAPIDQKVLKALWWKITGDSFVVDIRLLGGPEDGARYVSKYVSKPFSNTVVNKPDALCELLSALAGRRLVLTFGTWRGFKLTEKIDATDWKSLCPLPILYERVDAGDADAYAIMRALENVCPDARVLAGRSPPPD